MDRLEDEPIEEEESEEEYCIFKSDKICPLSEDYNLEVRIAKLYLPCRSDRSLDTGAVTWIAIVLTIQVIIAIATYVALT
jgi:hypothetical protein